MFRPDETMTFVTIDYEAARRAGERNADPDRGKNVFRQWVEHFIAIEKGTGWPRISNNYKGDPEWVLCIGPKLIDSYNSSYGASQYVYLRPDGKFRVQDGTTSSERLLTIEEMAASKLSQAVLGAIQNGVANPTGRLTRP